MNHNQQECPRCDESITELNDAYLDGAPSVVDGVEWEMSVRGHCPACDAELSLYATTGHIDLIETEYEVEYEGGLLITVTEMEARETYAKHHADYEWESFDENWNEAVEMTARKKAAEINEESSEDITLTPGVCRGVWEVHPEVEEALGTDYTNDARRKAMRAYAKADNAEEMVTQLGARGFAADESEVIASDIFPGGDFDGC